VDVFTENTVNLFPDFVDFLDEVNFFVDVDFFLVDMTRLRLKVL
jgi:hypothetical protein